MAVTEYIDDVQELYVAYFSRPADVAGLDFWTAQMDAGQVGDQEISAAFSASEEYQVMFQDMDHRAIVSEVYENLFGRVAETAGIDFWAAALDNGTITIDNVVTRIADGAQGDDEVAFLGKVAVAIAFTARVDTDQETAAYDGPAANQIAMEYLGGVRDVGTIADHLDPDQIDAAIARIVGIPEASAADTLAA